MQFRAYPIATNLKRLDFFGLESCHRDSLTPVTKLSTAHTTICLSQADDFSVQCCCMIDRRLLEPNGGTQIQPLTGCRSRSCIQMSRSPRQHIEVPARHVSVMACLRNLHTSLGKYTIILLSRPRTRVSQTAQRLLSGNLRRLFRILSCFASRFFCILGLRAALPHKRASGTGQPLAIMLQSSSYHGKAPRPVIFVHIAGAAPTVLLLPLP